MKKHLFIIYMLAMLMLSWVMPVQASERIRPIPSVRLTINTGDLTAGDYLADDASSYVSVQMDNQYYYLESADWLDMVNMLNVGDQPRIKIYINALPKETYTERLNTIYLFRGSYNSSNVHITNGEFISAAVTDIGYTLEITVRIKSIKGIYDPPYEAYWSSAKGTAVWTESQNSSGYFDVTCYRGSSVVKKLTNYHGTMYNFYPYMTKAGDYSFRVRAVAPPSISSTVGRNSEWTESNIMTIGDGDISDGTGQTTLDENGGSSLDSVVSGNSSSTGTGSANSAGWVQTGGYWYFRYPNGQLVTNGWLTINGKSYMFDQNGRMYTGWAQDKNGIWYYFDPKNGDMRTGWVHDDGKWYYMNTTKDEFEGCLVRNLFWTVGDRTYYFNSDGVMVTGWYQVNGNWYYFYPEGSTGGAYGYMARNTVIDGVFYVDQNGVWVQSGKN